MKILQISTYPIVKLLHGGQIRVKNIQEELIKLGHQVKSISFSEYAHKSFDDDLDYIVNGAALTRIIQTPFSTDLATAFKSKDSKAMKNFLTKHLSTFKPDYIFLEQPWLWPLIKLLLDNEELKDIKIIYSSQNIEYLTKSSLFDSNNIIDRCGVIESIKIIESELCLRADVVLGCTNTDLKEFIKLGAQKTVLCPNGVSNIPDSKESLDKIKSLVGERKYALFVGSAYPPNAQGFWDMLGNSMAWLSPDEMIIVVGGCSMILDDFSPKESKIYDLVNFEKIKKLGFVENDELGALISNASLIMLPITAGGGSNLKTAEAILSGKPVVATTKSCHGFSDISKYSNFFVTDDPKEFRKLSKRYLNVTKLDLLEDNELNLRKQVVWSNTLINLNLIF